MANSYPNPLQDNPAYAAVKIVVKLRSPTQDLLSPGRSTSKDAIFFQPEEVRACIVTCGGLCPGLNSVIREIVCGLWTQYGFETF
ncbi:hypothetical protein R1sor_009581 [Riccia sorocarpa]|uniref:ATP-dependent 6-phosphofructokinase n=1 Tax=Riccia sorocarpa TaxID=122646 RepID=A0ABD3HVG5_9MARC